MPNGTGLDIIRELNRHPNPPAADGAALVSPTLTRRLINHYIQHPPVPITSGSL
jgi:hypothetical protein